MCGATFIVHRAFDAEAFIATVERERVTHTMLVPSQIIAILNAAGFDPARLSSLQMVLSLGAPLHKEYKDRLNRLLPDRFYELYGLTEGFITVLDRDDAQRKAGSVGVPPPFYSMRIVGDDGCEVPAGQVGEILGRGPITMPGYFNRPDLTAQALAGGWLHTGDLGYVDEEGFLYLVDRKKDMIDSGGVKVYPKDIEEIGACSPGRPRNRRVRHPARQVGRNAGGRGRIARTGGDRRGDAQGLDQCAGRGEIPACRPRADPGRLSAQRGRQDPEARVACTLLGRPRSEDLIARYCRMRAINGCSDQREGGSDGPAEVCSVTSRARMIAG